MNSKDPFKWRHFQGEIILLNVRWYAQPSQGGMSQIQDLSMKGLYSQ